MSSLSKFPRPAAVFLPLTVFTWEVRDHHPGVSTRPCFTLIQKLFAGSGTAAVPPGSCVVESTAPHLSTVPSCHPGTWQVEEEAQVFCHSLGGTALSSPPQPDSEGCSLHLEGEWRMAERDGRAKQVRDCVLQSQTAS